MLFEKKSKLIAIIAILILTLSMLTFNTEEINAAQTGEVAQEANDTSTEEAKESEELVGDYLDDISNAKLVGAAAAKSNFEAIKYNMGVYRADETFKNNVLVFTEEIQGLFKAGFAFVLFVAIIWTGINTVLKNQDAKARAEYIERFKNIIFGVILFASIGVIVSIASDFQKNSLMSIYGTNIQDNTVVNDLDAALEESWISDILCSILEFLANIVEGLLQLVMGLITGNISNIGGADTSINNAVFLSQFHDQLSLANLANKHSNGIVLTTAPFTLDEWNKYTQVYALLSSLFIPLMVIGLIKTSYELVIGAGNIEKISEAKNTILRIVVGIAIITMGPYLFRLLLTIFNMLVFLIPCDFEEFTYEMKENIGLISLITHVWMMFIKLKILITMLVREVMLTVMYLATPIVIGIWVISDKFKSVQLWMGETLSNAATQFCYALVLFLSTVIIHGGQGNPFLVLIWYSMMIKVADFFKDSLQGLLSRWGGINESGIAAELTGKVVGWAEKAATTVSKAVDEDQITKGTVFLNNTLATANFLTKGDASGFMSEGKRIREYGKILKGKANEAFSINNQIHRSGQFDLALKNDEALILNNMYDELATIDSSDETRINAMKKQIEDYAIAHKGNVHVNTIDIARSKFNEGQKLLNDGLRIEARGKAVYQEHEIFQGFVNSMSKRKEDRMRNYVNVYGTKEVSRRYQLSNRDYEKIQKFNEAHAGINPKQTRPDLSMLPRHMYTPLTTNRQAEKLARSNALDNGYYGAYKYVAPKRVIKYSNLNVEVNETEFIKKAQEHAKTDAKIGTDLQKQLEAYRNKVEKDIRERREAVDRMIDNQKTGKERGLTDDVRRQNMKKTNDAVAAYVRHMVEHRNAGLIEKNDSIARDLEKLIRNVEINGDDALAAQLREEASEYNLSK